MADIVEFEGEWTIQSGERFFEMKKMKLHNLKDLFVIGQPIKNKGAVMSAISHAQQQVDSKHYIEKVTAVQDDTDATTGVITRSLSWTMTPTDAKAPADPAPSLG